MSVRVQYSSVIAELQAKILAQSAAKYTEPISPSNIFAKMPAVEPTAPIGLMPRLEQAIARADESAIRALSAQISAQWLKK